MKIKISWRKLPIIFSNKTLVLNGNICSGICKDDQLEINTTYPIEQQRETLLHEVIHALDHIYGFDFSEDQVKGLSNALFETLKENKRVKDFIF